MAIAHCGWNTHASQGNAGGRLANNLGALASALVQFRRNFSQPTDVVVASEFGRPRAEIGTGGTDHGHGNAMWLMGEETIALRHEAALQRRLLHQERRQRIETETEAAARRAAEQDDMYREEQ